MAEIGKTRDAVTRVGDATGHDGVEMRKFRFHIDGYAVERHPALEPHADRGGLGLEARTLVRPLHPDPDAILAPLTPHVQGGERPDNPSFQARNIAPHLCPPPLPTHPPPPSPP